MKKFIDKKGNEVYVSYTDDGGVNTFGLFCQVFADKYGQYEIFNFWVHPEDCNCKDDKAVEKFIKDYIAVENCDDLLNDYTQELCPECNEEVTLDAKLGVQRCPHCGKWIVACSMCEHPSRCLDCPLEKRADRLNKEEEGKRTYIVEVTRELYATIEVQADSRDDARKIAEERISDLGQDDWKDYGEVKITSIS